MVLFVFASSNVMLLIIDKIINILPKKCFIFQILIDCVTKWITNQCMILSKNEN